MKATQHLSQIRTGKIIMALAAALWCASPVDAALQAQSYDTPAYVDFEMDEWTLARGESIELTVHRTGDFRQVTRVDFRTVEGTATEGRDYKGTGGTLVFQPQETYKTITISALDLDPAEQAESFALELTSDDPNVFLVRDTATIWIAGAAPEAPKLQIRAGSGGTIVLSWNAGSDCVLERASTLNTSDWEPVPGEPELVDGKFQVREEIRDPVYMYRLRVR